MTQAHVGTLPAGRGITHAHLDAPPAPSDMTKALPSGQAITGMTHAENGLALGESGPGHAHHYDRGINDATVHNLAGSPGRQGLKRSGKEGGVEDGSRHVQFADDATLESAASFPLCPPSAFDVPSAGLPFGTRPLEGSDALAGTSGSDEDVGFSERGIDVTASSASMHGTHMRPITVTRDKRACLSEVYSLRYGRDEVLAFSCYAACRLLGTTPEEAGHGNIFEALRTIAAFFLRADLLSICDCINAFGLNDILFSVARMAEAFSPSEDEPEWGSLGPVDEDPEPNATCGFAVRGRPNPTGAPVDAEEPSTGRLKRELGKVRSVVAALLHELEVLLYEYLSADWDRLDEVLDANMPDLRDDGLFCGWSKSSQDLRSLTSSASFLSSPSSTAGSSGDGLLGASVGDLASLDTNASEYESFEDYMRHLREGRAESPSREAGAAAAGSSELSRRRARSNWRRAKSAAKSMVKQVMANMVSSQYKFPTLFEMFQDGQGGALGPPPPVDVGRRRPVLLLLGGGMAAGKSTVREIIGHDDFWSKVGRDAVVVEADAIKNSDSISRSLSRMNSVRSSPDLLKYVHEYSTMAAETLLINAVNQQKDIVFDGTMTWAPFMEQTIAMVRDHAHNYKRGPGYHTNSRGETVERYWEVDEACKIDCSKKVAYRIELVGCTCDAGLAVARGVWRKVRTGRGVPVSAQLRSHRLFSENFARCAMLVDVATLYHTGSALTTFSKCGADMNPVMIAHRSRATRGEMLVNPRAYDEFLHKKNIRDDAVCRTGLYGDESDPQEHAVPTSDEKHMATLRGVLRAADRRDRVQRRASDRRRAAAP